MWKGELVNENCKEEPVCLKYSEGLVIVSNRSSFVRVEGRARREEPVCLKYSEGLVIVSNRSSSVRVEGRARQ